MKRSLKLFVIASVLLNLLLAGVVAGYASRQMFDDNRSANQQRVAAALPEQQRELFLTAMKQVEAQNKPLRAQLAKARKESLRLLRAEPFDRAAYMTQVERIQELRGQMLHTMAEAMAGLAGQFTAEERATLATLFSKPKPEREALKEKPDA